MMATQKFPRINFDTVHTVLQEKKRSYRRGYVHLITATYADKAVQYEYSPQDDDTRSRDDDIELYVLSEQDFESILESIQNWTKEHRRVEATKDGSHGYSSYRTQTILSVNAPLPEKISDAQEKVIIRLLDSYNNARREDIPDKGYEIRDIHTSTFYKLCEYGVLEHSNTDVDWYNRSHVVLTPRAYNHFVTIYPEYDYEAWSARMDNIERRRKQREQAAETFTDSVKNKIHDGLPYVRQAYMSLIDVVPPQPLPNMDYSVCQIVLFVNNKQGENMLRIKWHSANEKFYSNEVLREAGWYVEVMGSEGYGSYKDGYRVLVDNPHNLIFALSIAEEILPTLQEIYEDEQENESED